MTKCHVKQTQTARMDEVMPLHEDALDILTPFPSLNVSNLVYHQDFFACKINYVSHSTIYHVVYLIWIYLQCEVNGICGNKNNISSLLMNICFNFMNENSVFGQVMFVLAKHKSSTATEIVITMTSVLSSYTSNLRCQFRPFTFLND